MDKKFLDSIWINYGGRIAGTVAGILFGIIFLFVGFWKTLFFAILVGFGFYIGHYLDGKEDFKKIIDAMFLDKWMRK